MGFQRTVALNVGQKADAVFDGMVEGQPTYRVFVGDEVFIVSVPADLDPSQLATYLSQQAALKPSERRRQLLG